MSESTKTVVTIFDQVFRIGSDTTDASSIQDAATALDERMRRVAGSSKRRVPLEVAILAAMEIADEVLRERDKRDHLLTDADERITRFTRRLEDGGDPDPTASDSDEEGPRPRF